MDKGKYVKCITFIVTAAEGKDRKITSENYRIEARYEKRRNVTEDNDYVWQKIYIKIQ